MTDFLPLFPLKLVVFPSENLNLHIFEPRYRQLVRECTQNGVTFGIPAYIDNKVMDWGTEMKVKAIVKTYDDGKLDIKTEGIGLFKIDQFYTITPNKLYAGADIERLSFSTTSDFELNVQILEQLKNLFDVLNITKPLPKDAHSFVTYDIAHHIGLSLQQEYELLKIQSETKRQQYVLKHLIGLIPIVKEMERLRKKAQMNGHFKHIIPPKF